MDLKQLVLEIIQTPSLCLDLDLLGTIMSSNDSGFQHQYDMKCLSTPNDIQQVQFSQEDRVYIEQMFSQEHALELETWIFGKK